MVVSVEVCCEYSIISTVARHQGRLVWKKPDLEHEIILSKGVEWMPWVEFSSLPRMNTLCSFAGDAV